MTGHGGCDCPICTLETKLGAERIDKMEAAASELSLLILAKYLKLPKHEGPGKMNFALSLDRIEDEEVITAVMALGAAAQTLSEMFGAIPQAKHLLGAFYKGIELVAPAGTLPPPNMMNPFPPPEGIKA